MTNREHLMAMLDEDPSDQATRSILADLIEENPDDEDDVWFARGLRWMVENNKYPYKSESPYSEFWPVKETGERHLWNWFYETIFLVNKCHQAPFRMRFKAFWSRHEAEVALAKSIRENVALQYALLAVFLKENGRE